MSVLLGTAATAGLNASALGLTFGQIPVGTYEVGDFAYEDNPPRSVALDAFELANTPTTNRQLAAALRQLGDQNTVLMFESDRNRSWAIAARGTQKEIAGLSTTALREAVITLRLSPSRQEAKRVGEFFVEGALRTFNLGEDPVTIVPVTLEPHLPKGFEGDNQPALMSHFESAAVAALFGLILPTGEMWEAAAGDLRDERYRDEEELRRVAHFRPAEVTAEVGTKEPNRRGLYDMLGNVWEWMANRYKNSGKSREIRGGSWCHGPENVRAASRDNFPPVHWNRYIGCRFGRQDSRG